jgi:dihydrodipicolinate synthase/N-acetylneuraminate lyase
MKPLSSSEISGTWGAVLLPLNPDDSIDYAALADEIDALIDAGLDGLYTNGTAGEFHAQTEEEFDRVSALVAERCERRRVPFQLGVCHMSAQVSRARLWRAKALAPGAMQVILPDWVPVTDDEAQAFLEAMAEIADPIGLVLYTPGHAKRAIVPAEIARLRDAVPDLAGVKMPDGDAAWYAGMRRHLPGLSVFVPGHHLATGLREGASGSYSNVACLSPRGAVEWNRQMKRDPAAALAFEARLRAFFQEHMRPLVAQGFSPPALDKALAAAGGWCRIAPRLRWPYRSLDAAMAEELGRRARAALPELWP